jgi:TPR repeat protein
VSKRLTKAQRAERMWAEASGLEDREKFDEAIKLYARAAKLGHGSAQVNLGNLLDHWKVRPVRWAEALYWYKRAISGGHASAAWNAAMHYRNIGEPRGYKHWIEVAARMGHWEGPRELQKLELLLDEYRHPSRAKDTIFWCKRAVRQGSPTAAWTLAKHYGSLGKSRSQKHWTEVAARMGDPDAAQALRKTRKQAQRRQRRP